MNIVTPNLGNNFFIRSLQYSDADNLAKLGNNPNIVINQRDSFPYPYTVEFVRNWIQHAKENQSTTQNRFAIIYETEVIGEIGLYEQQDVHRFSAEICYWIGEPYWNCGVMTKAVKWMTQHGFEQMKLKRIYADIIAYNKASQRVLEKCGFTIDGIMRKNIYKNEAFYDHIVFSLLNTDK